jgi:hypothetical protein
MEDGGNSAAFEVPSIIKKQVTVFLANGSLCIIRPLFDAFQIL